MINELKVFVEQSKCGDYCLSIKRCTHFSAGMLGSCWVKDMHGASVVQTVDKTTLLCGFIPVSYFITFTWLVITYNLMNNLQREYREILLIYVGKTIR